MATIPGMPLAQSEDPCPECTSVLLVVEQNSPESCFLCMDIAVTVLNNRPNKKQIRGDRRRERTHKLDELLQKITALRNSKGGILLVHITGLCDGDRFLGYFDEFVDEKLNKLIEDGKQFSDTYSRFWLSENINFSKCKDFVCLTVKSSSSISTTDFKTKIPLDCGIENPSTTNIISLLSEKRQFPNTTLTIRGSSHNLTQLNESRSVQLKAFKVTEDKEKELLKDITKLCSFIWNELRLREYISAFTKVESGGSYFLGLEEVERIQDSAHGDYFTKVIQVHGLPLPTACHSELKSKLGEIITKEILIRDYDGQAVQTPPGLWDVLFHDASKHVHDRDVYVLEVSVRQMAGIVFYENSGPKSFRLIQNKIVPVDGNTWFRMIKKLTNSFKERN